jgi:hypothetical protein
MVDETNQVEEENVSVDDLDKIMQEIVQEDAPTDAAPQVMSTSQVAAPQTPPVEVTRPITNVTPLKAVAEPKPKSAVSSNFAGDQALKLEFTGPINLKLAFTTGNKTIEISCSDDALVCKMADGTEFKIPTSALGSARKSA